VLKEKAFAYTLSRNNAAAAICAIAAVAKILKLKTLAGDKT